MKSKYYLIMLLIFMQYQSAFSQSLDASPAGVMISHNHPKGGLMFSYTFMNVQQQQSISNSSKISDNEIFVNYLMAPQKMQMQMHMLMAMYGLSGRITLMAMTDYNLMHMNMKMLPGTMHMHGGTMEMTMDSTDMNIKTTGIGDLKIWTLIKLHNGEGSSLMLSAGINIPTGKINLDGGNNVMFEGQRLPYMMQQGSGSIDFMPGITYLKKSKNLSWSAQALSVIRPFYNSIGYHYGNELDVNCWIAYNLNSFISASLRAEGNISGTIQGTDKKVYAGMEPDANTANYGGTKTNAYAGFNFYINKGFLKQSKAGVEFGIPFYQHLNGIQLSNHNYLNAGITKSF